MSDTFVTNGSSGVIAEGCQRGPLLSQYYPYYQGDPLKFVVCAGNKKVSLCIIALFSAPRQRDCQ